MAGVENLVRVPDPPAHLDVSLVPYKTVGRGDPQPCWSANLAAVYCPPQLPECRRRNRIRGTLVKATYYRRTASSLCCCCRVTRTRASAA